MNNVTFVGNVCRDFDLRQTASGTSVTSNTIAVRRDRKEPNGEYASDFFDIICYGGQADYAVKNLKKGDKIAVGGSVHIRDYVSRNGIKGRAVEVMVNSIENLTPKAADADVAPADNQLPTGPGPATAPASNEVKSTNLDGIEISDDDLPF